MNQQTTKCQYDEIRKVVEAAKVYEGVQEVLEAQGDKIDTTKSDLVEIKSHVITQTVWKKDIDEQLSHIPMIRDQAADIHVLFMAHFYSPSNDAIKKGEEKKNAALPAMPIHTPTSGDWYTILAKQAVLVLASQKNIVTNFGIPQGLQSRFKGWKNPKYSDNKTMEQIAKEGIERGVQNQKSIQLSTYLHGVTNQVGMPKEMAKYLLRHNAELKQNREEQEKAKNEKEARLKKADEFRTAKKNGFINDGAAQLSKIIFDYVKEVGINQSYGRITAKFTYW